MKFLFDKLTKNQIERIFHRPLDRVMLTPPSPGFEIYSDPGDSKPLFVNVPMTSQGQSLIVLESKSGFHRVNFFDRPFPSDVWVTDYDLRRRGIIETIFVIIFFGSFYLIKNYFTRSVTHGN